MFSFESLPFSLFYNTGQRHMQNRNHFNRWLPASLSQSLLTPFPLVTFVDDELVLHKRNLSKSTLAYIVEEIVPKSGEYHIRLKGEDKVCLIRPRCDANDELDVRSFQSTCIIIENRFDYPGQRVRGACFYVSSLKESTRTRPYTYEVHLVFHCPVDIEYIQGGATSQTAYDAWEVRPWCKVVIKYGRWSQQLQQSPPY